MQIIYEDAALLALNKPAGLTSEAGVFARHPTAEAWAREYLTGGRTGKAQPHVRAVHRIDRPASGVLLLAKTKSALSELMRQFEARTVQKRYLVEVEQPLPAAEGTLRHWLMRDETGKRALAFDAPRDGAQLAELSYRTLDDDRRRAEIELHTGRFHQIRAQLAHIGCAVVGDVAYGAAPWLEHQIRLHAWKLLVHHPHTGQRLELSAEPDWQV